MKLFLLKAKDHSALASGKDPWRGRYDMNYGFVVRAETESQARDLAAKKAGDETPIAWLGAEFSTCIELLPDGQPEIVLYDFHAG